jgi:hypothetical protein
MCYNLKNGEMKRHQKMIKFRGLMRPIRVWYRSKKDLSLSIRSVMAGIPIAKDRIIREKHDKFL